MPPRPSFNWTTDSVMTSSEIYLLDPIKISRYRHPIFGPHLDRLWEQVHNCPISFPMSI